MRILKFLLMAALCSGSVCAEPLARPAVTAVEAELLADLEARNLKPGGTLYAKVTAEWNGLGCALKKGAVIEARVTSVVPHSKTSKASEVSLSFSNAECGKAAMEPFALDLVALAAPEEDDSSVSMDMPRVLGSTAPTQGSPSGFRSMTSANSDIWWSMQYLATANKNLRVGAVYGLKGLKLSVGTGPQNSSVLSSNDRNVALDKRTMLLLIPGSTVSARAKTQENGTQPSVHADASRGSEAAAGPGNQNQATQADEEDIQTCTPPECSIDLTTDEPDSDRRAMERISIEQMGFTSRLQREMAALNHDETLTYLSSTELLVTFNPHLLVPRYGATTPDSTIRVIRAALLDVTNKKVMRAMDWDLPDTKQYLWLLANHRVLVHVRDELRVYGPGLKEEARIPLGGPLNFVRTDPAGKTIAFGIVHERHSPELHAKLQEGQEQEPEEDVQIRVLNDKFDVIATAMTDSNRMPPTLLDEGEVKFLRQPDKRIHMVMHTWDNQLRSLARFTSSCAPQLSSLAPDLLFMVTCDASTGGREYMVMRPDGNLVLRGESSLQELGHAAIGNEEKKEFAVRILKSDQATLPGAVFRPTDLESEQFGVYRAADGKRVFSVRVSNPSASNGGYALSPDGDQLAVLARDGIEIYAVPQK